LAFGFWQLAIGGWLRLTPKVIDEKARFTLS
jgi:hypothetical protein